ncbi:MAG: class I SAM-dependent methyltransferase [Lysobacteraceae bacterium]|nr:MAG: class I SAM-dependent methyltransferase [Xanthomonadaceae bacterium]
MEEQLYRTFYEIEQKHWWFVARQRIVEDLIRRRIGLAPGSQVLDVGCGTGAILSMLSKQFEAYGTDTSPLAIELCGKRGLKNAFQCTLESFPRPDLRFNLITLLDVIEHIDDDLAVLQQARGYLKDGGSVLITVPAYQWLWSRHDDLNHHKRRYTKAGLAGVLDRAGLQPAFLSYYNTLLFPAALAGRMIQKAGGSTSDTTLTIPPSPLNALLTSVFSSERHLLGMSPLPFGLSLVAIAKPD